MIYLIGGVARAGKSTLARMLLNQQKISNISTDTIRYAFEQALPEQGVTYVESSNHNNLAMWPFIKAMIENYLEDGISYCIEGDNLVPEYIAQLPKSAQIKVCFVGMKSIDVEEKYSLMRKYVFEGDWIASRPKTEVINALEEGKMQSRILESSCAKLGIDYYDTSEDFNTSINQIYQKITA